MDARLGVDAMLDGVADDPVLELSDGPIDDELRVEATALDDMLRVELERMVLELTDRIDDRREDVDAALDEARGLETELETEADLVEDLVLDAETEGLIVEI